MPMRRRTLGDEDRQLECQWNHSLPQKGISAVFSKRESRYCVLSGDQDPMRSEYTGLSSVLEPG